MAQSAIRELQELLLEQRRRQEFALTLYRPTPKQEKFHRCDVGERIVRGGHRAGKSTSAALEVAHAATKVPIICEDGSEVPYKYPERPLRIWIIGKDEDHIGDTIYTLLFKGGLFYVIDDEETGKPRIWNPRDPRDVLRKSERRTSGPMIPPEFIDDRGFVWVNKGKHVFSNVTLKNGTEIYAYPSGGDCPSGVPVDLIWIDEDIKYPEYVADWQGRLIDRSGRLIWSAFPWARNDALVQLSQRAQKESDNPHADIREFQLFMSENPYLDPNEVQKAQDRWASAGELVLAARDRGEFPMDAVLMYPEYSRDVHGISNDYMPTDCEAANILHINGGEPPDDWMRLMALDPGSRKACVIFATIPPPDVGNEIIIYDEIFQVNSDAKALAKEVKNRTHGRSFYRFIIDGRAARQTPLGFGKTVLQQYTEAFTARDIRAENGTIFADGNDNVQYRTNCVRELLRMEEGKSHPRLLFYLPRTPRTQWEFSNYKRRISHKEYLDEPIPANNDAMNCFDPETEVLTESGWKFFRDVSDEDLLATVNLDSDVIEFQKPTRLISQEYSGDMVRFGGLKMNAFVTANHRMVVYPLKGYTGYDGGRPVIKPASEVSKYDRLKLVAKWNGTSPKHYQIGDVKVPYGDWMEFLGWYLAEGHSDSNPIVPGTGYRVNIAQKKPHMVKELKALLDRMPLHFTEHDHGFSASNKALWEELRHCGNCYSKRVPRYVMNSASEDIERFLHGAISGDGNLQHGSRSYFSVSKGLADDVQELMIRIGKTGSVRVRHQKGVTSVLKDGRTITGTTDLFLVKEWQQPRAGLMKHDGTPNYAVEQWSGTVYCATVPNGTLIVRRQGKPLIAGNCVEYISASPFLSWKRPMKNNQRPAALRAWDRMNSMFGHDERQRSGVLCGPSLLTGRGTNG